MGNKIIIDVREPEEFAAEHVQSAINVPLFDIRSGVGLDVIPKGGSIITYCRSGNRSEIAKELLSSRGFTDVTNGINKETVEAEYLD